MGATPPMGHDVLAAPAGPPFALLATPDGPWPASTGKSAGYQFRGYHLDDLLRPAFSYDFGGVHVTDYPVAVPGKDDSGLKRTLTFQSDNPPANLYMRAAAGDDIKRLSNGDYLIDGRLTLRLIVPGMVVSSARTGAEVPIPVLSDTGAAVRTSQGRMELLVPIRFMSNKAAVEEDFTW
jgi:hypothetical protein